MGEKTCSIYLQGNDGIYQEAFGIEPFTKYLKKKRKTILTFTLIDRDIILTQMLQNSTKLMGFSIFNFFEPGRTTVFI